MTLRRRVILGCALTALVLFVADIALVTTFRSYLLTQLDGQVTEAARRVAVAGGGPPPGGERPFPGGVPPTADNPALSEYFLGRADADGRIVQRLGAPLSAQGDAVPRPDRATVVASVAPSVSDARPFEATSADGGRWRLVAVAAGDPDGDDPPIVIVGGSLASLDATYLRMAGVLAIATVAVLATLAAVAWWVLRHGVRPLAAMTSTAGAIAAGALSERVPRMDPRTEAGRLGQALNSMLVQIEGAFRQRAASQDRLRSFVADASHELRTPLTSVRGYAELYRAGGLSDPAALDDAMRRVEQEAARMSDLVDDLLVLAKLDEGRAVQWRSVRLDEVASDVVRDARAVEPDRPVSCEVEPIEIVADEAGLRQAIGNLVANARAHTPAGTSVDVTLRRDGRWAVLEVADDGPGMEPDVAAHVFERFYRVDLARSRASGGSGLGLAIVAGVAEAHHGSTEVDTAPGAGARFRLRLPLSRPDQPV